MLLTTGCEQDYRNLSLFEGAEPIYQVGVCDNLLSSVTLYLNVPDGIVLGVDGGDGDYAVECSDSAVAKAVFVQSVNGYPRVKVLPKAVGEASVKVTDGSGLTILLNVNVKERFSVVFRKTHAAFACKGDIDDASWQAIRILIEEAEVPVRNGGYYELMPDNNGELLEGGGKLLVYPTGDVGTVPLEGTYRVEADTAQTKAPTFHLCYDGMCHVLTLDNPLEEGLDKPVLVPSMVVWEEMTHRVPTALLPQGCEVYYGEGWMQE